MPEVPGLVFRRFRGEADYGNILAIISASKLADQVERADTLEDIARNYSHLVNCDPYRDMIFAEVRGEAVGYARSMWSQETRPENWVYSHFGFLKPEWRRKGIGRAMLHFCQRRLRVTAAGQMGRGERSLGTPAIFRSWAEDTEIDTSALLEAEGYQPARWFYQMVRPNLEAIPDLKLPAGVEIRPVDWDSHKKQIFTAEQEALQDHWGHTEPTEADYQAWLASVEEDENVDTALWRVAWQGDQVVGMVRSFIHAQENQEYERRRGYTEFISVRRPWRRQGVARVLIADSLRGLKALGMQEAALGVDTENPSGALRLYEFMGFRPVKKETVYQKPLG
jgi:GNAT superfamily N-acetyltransferase